MHIAMISASLGEGGLERHVRELTAQLLLRGHAVSVLADPQQLARLPAGAVGVPIKMHRARWHPALLWQVWSALRRLQPTVVHAHANKATAVLARVLPYLGLPAVATLHNQKSHNAVFADMHGVIAVSEPLRHLVAHENIAVIYHGIAQQPRAKRAQDAIALTASDPFTLCAIGRLVSAKGFDVLLDAVDGLPLRLWIAGAGEAEASLQQRIKGLAPATQVQLLGHVEDIPSLIQQCHGVVISSRREGFSYVCGEALMARVPVIATDVPIANALLPKPWLVPIEDPLALRHAIQRAMQDPVQWRASLAPVFDRAPSQLSLDTMATHTERMYVNTLARYQSQHA